MVSKNAIARSKFAELRALKQSGKKRTYEVEQQEDLYEEVDEAGYNKVVRERLNQDDFVVGDNGEGYVDDGREEWGRQPGYGTDIEEELPVKGQSGKAGEQIVEASLMSPWLIFMQQNGNAKRRRPRRRTQTGVSVITLRKVL